MPHTDAGKILHYDRLVEGAEKMIREDPSLVALALDGGMEGSSWARYAIAMAGRSEVQGESKLLSLTVEGGGGSEGAGQSTEWEEDTDWLVLGGYIRGLDMSSVLSTTPSCHTP